MRLNWENDSNGYGIRCVIGNDFVLRVEPHGDKWIAAIICPGRPAFYRSKQEFDLDGAKAQCITQGVIVARRMARNSTAIAGLLAKQAQGIRDDALLAKEPK